MNFRVMSLSSSTLTSIFSIIFLIAVYSPAILNDFAWSDDYPTLLNPSQHALHSLRDGRPLYSLWLLTVFHTVNSIEDAIFLRVFNVLCILALHLMVSNFLARYLTQFSKSLIIASSAVAFTAFSWQTVVYSVVGSGLLLSALFSSVCLIVNDRIRRPFLTFLLFLAAVGFYPLYALFFISVIMIFFILPSSNKFEFRRLLDLVFFLSLSLIVNLVFTRILLSQIGQGFNPRVSLSIPESIIDRIVFFLTRPFVLSFTPFQILSHPRTSFLPHFLIMTIGLLILARQLKINAATFLIRIWQLSVGVFVLVSPLLFVNQQQIELRFISCSGWIISFLVALGYLNFLVQLRSFKLKTIICFSSSVALSVIFVTNMNLLVVQPQLHKNAFLVSELENCESFQNVVILERTSPWPTSDRMGILSQSTDLASFWVPKPNVQLIVNDILPKTAPPTTAKHPRCIVNLDEYVPLS